MSKDTGNTPTIEELVNDARASFVEQCTTFGFKDSTVPRGIAVAAFNNAITELVMMLDAATEALADTVNDNASNCRLLKHEREQRAALASQHARLGIELATSQDRVRSLRAKTIQQHEQIRRLYAPHAPNEEHARALVHYMAATEHFVGGATTKQYLRASRAVRAIFGADIFEEQGMG